MATDAPRPAHNGWTTETALQHVLSLIGSNDHRYEQRFLDIQRLSETQHAAHRDAVSAAMAAADRAVLKAEVAAEKRFESVNEFRNTLADQQRNLMPRSEADREFAAMAEKIRSLEKQHDALVSERKGIAGGYGYAVGVVGFVLAIASIIALVIKTVP